MSSQIFNNESTYEQKINELYKIVSSLDSMYYTVIAHHPTIDIDTKLKYINQMSRVQGQLLTLITTLKKY